MYDTGTKSPQPSQNPFGPLCGWPLTTAKTWGSPTTTLLEDVGVCLSTGMVPLSSCKCLFSQRSSERPAGPSLGCSKSSLISTLHCGNNKTCHSGEHAYQILFLAAFNIVEDSDFLVSSLFFTKPCKCYNKLYESFCVYSVHVTCRLGCFYEQIAPPLDLFLNLCRVFGTKSWLVLPLNSWRWHWLCRTSSKSNKIHFRSWMFTIITYWPIRSRFL